MSRAALWSAGYDGDDDEFRFQVFLFYPGDWSDQSQAFLSSFCSVRGGLGREDCLVYGVSSDTVNDHQAGWSTLIALVETHRDTVL